MLVLEPKLMVLDETDSGLDIDALKIVSDGINAMRSPERATILVTHYQRLLDYVQPDFVHVLAGGRIVKTGGEDRPEERRGGNACGSPCSSRWRPEPTTKQKSYN